MSKATGRRWYTRGVMLFGILRRTREMLRRQKLDVLVPVLIVLIICSLMFWALSSVSPLAPFVYSLF